ncbi:hypothetical protein IAT38_003241 [Cryptococcus sp. DSM 104549]
MPSRISTLSIHRLSSLPLSLLFSLILLPSTSAVRKMTVDNQCSTSIYIAVGGQGGLPTKIGGGSQPGGWEQEVGEYSFNVPDGWNNGRIWARTGCTKSGDSLDCIIGACMGNSVGCSGSEFGTAGATLAEFTIDAENLDSYDISIVDGYNLPMEITPSDSSCHKGSCGAETDILTQCDPALVVPKGSDKIYSCGSACGNLVQFQHSTEDGTSGGLMSADPDNSAVCCRQGGAGVDHKDCPNTYIPFYKAMKSMCHDAYIYSDDDMYEDAVFTCSSSDKPSYTVTFCPGGQGAGVHPPSASSAVSQDSTSGDNAGNLQGGQDTVSIWDGLTGTPVESGGSNGTSGASGASGPSSTGLSSGTRGTTGTGSKAGGGSTATGGVTGTADATTAATTGGYGATTSAEEASPAITTAVSTASAVDNSATGNSDNIAVQPTTSAGTAPEATAPTNVAPGATSSGGWGGHRGGGDWLAAVAVPAGRMKHQVEFLRERDGPVRGRCRADSMKKGLGPSKCGHTLSV